MANPRAFISFDYDHDKTSKDLFVGQSKNSTIPFDFQDWAAKSSMPQDKWKALVEEQMKMTNMCIVLVGKHMKSAIGVKAEIKMATANNIRVFGVYVEDKKEVINLPEGLSVYRTTEWKWDKISSWIDKAMKEGKNKPN